MACDACTIRSIRLPLCIVVFALSLSVPAAAGAANIASHDDAFVEYDSSTDVWSIGSRGTQLSVGFDRAGTFAVQSLTNLSTGNSWDLTPAPDVAVTAGTERMVFSSRSGGMSFLGATARSTDTGVLLVFTFEHRGLHLRFLRSYAAYPDASVIETWTRIEAQEGSQPTDLSNLVGWQITMRSAAVKWVGGLRTNAAPGELEPFELAEGELDSDTSWELGSDSRSTENYLPFVSVDDGDNAFFGGILWSGAWRITCERRDDRLRVTAWFPETPTVALSRPIEIPHTFFGVATHGAADQATAIRHFLVNGLRGGRSFTPLVTYNTWFAYGTAITEDTVIAEIDRAAAIGVELFVVDAGWYPDAGRENDSDFESGLGRLTADSDRFPSGLAALAEHAHEAGMKFGLWVEPERVALDLLGEIGVREGWLATRNGAYEFDKVGQVCLAGAPARTWLVDRLSNLIQTVGPDYLKWDNNGWLNCNRAGHGHGSNDGNFAHVEGLYQVLREIRARFPDLLIENVSGGGNRLDFGMLR